MRRSAHSILSLLFVLSLAVWLPRAQAFTFFDDFSTYTVGSNLTGHTAPNGQVWATGGWSGSASTVIQADYGVGGSRNTGNVITAPDGQWYTNELPLGQQLTTGTITVEATLYKNYLDYENCSVYQQFGLKDSTNGTRIEIGWDGQYDAGNNWGMYIYVDGGGLSGTRVYVGPFDWIYAWMHITATIDMATKRLTIAYDDAVHGIFGSFDAGVITPPGEAKFEKPDTLMMTLYHRIYPYQTYRGFDNIRVTNQAAPPTSGLNNMVTELLDVSSPPIQQNHHYTFNNPRKGWVFIGADADITYPTGRMWAALDSAPESSAIFVRENAWPQISEAMRYMTAGEHTVDVNLEGDAVLNSIVVRAIPEILYAEIGTAFINSQENGTTTCLASYGPYNMRYLRNTGLLDNLNVLVERNPVLENDPYETDWIDNGKKIIYYSNLLWMPGWDTNPLPQDAYYNYWTSLPGMTDPKYSGIICDEFHISWPWIETNAASAVTRISGESQYNGHSVYGYSTADLYSFPEGRTFTQAMIGAGYKIAQEQYLEEKPTLSEAQSYMTSRLKTKMQNYLSYYPNCQEDFIYAIGYLSAPAETQDVDPNVDFKVWLDMQFQMLATDPTFSGLYGVMAYHSSLADEEIQRWTAKLYRHYCIEGSTTSLSSDPYLTTYIQNADFTSGTTGWTLSPAQAGTISTKSVPGFGTLSGRFSGGDTVIWTRRKSNAPNKFSQTITGLVPGRQYSLRMFTADYGEFVAGSSVKQLPTVSFNLQGVTLDPARSFHEVFSSGAAGHTAGPFNGSNYLYITWHRMVFTANSTTGTVTVSDWQSDSVMGGPAEQQLMHNFVEVQPYLEDIPAVDFLPPGAAAAPTDTGAFCRDSAVFNWTPATDNLSGIAGYYVNIGSSAGSGNIWNGYMGNVLTKTISPTVNTQKYYCSVAARDNAGNIGNYSASSDGIRADLVPPVPGTASAPANTIASPIQVTYSGASDSGNPSLHSGLNHVELWYKKEAGGPWTNTGLSSATASGSFSFALSDGTGTYYFDLVGEDNVGNRSGTPGGNGDTSTVYTLPTYDVTGQLTLEDYPADITLVPVTVELRKHGASTTTRTIYLNSLGNFTITGVEAGTYDLAFKGPNWLQALVQGVTVGP